MLKEGNKAPDFKGLNQDNREIQLKDFKNKNLILYFYPRDNTPGCTAESCNLNDNYKKLSDLGFEIVGVSPDNISSHQKFITKYNLKFNLIADVDKEILKKYNAWGEKKNYGRVYMGVLRKTFIIDKEGFIKKIFDKVKTKTHTEQILAEWNN